MNILMLILAILGIIATGLVGWLVHSRTKGLLKRVQNILVAEMTPEKYRTVLRLLEDMERSRVKRGTVNQKEDGSWGIDYVMEDTAVLGLKPQTSHKKQRK